MFDMWGKFAVAPDMDEVPDVDQYMMQRSVRRFRVHDLSRRHPDAER